MANQFVFADWVTMEGLRLLKNKLAVAQFFNTSYNKEFTKAYPIGEVVRVKLPQRFLIRDGLGYNPQSINRIYTSVKCDQVFGVDFEWDSVEAALKMERKEYVKSEYLDPAMAQIAQEIDSRAANWVRLHTPNIVGVLGTDPTSFTTFGQVRQRLIEQACPPGGERGMIIPPAVNTSMVAAAIQYFNPASDISRQYKEGSIGRNNGFDWYESMSLYDHTSGTVASTFTVNGANQTGSSLIVNMTAGDTLAEGDNISIGLVYPANPMTRRRAQSATTKQFVVRQALTAVGGGADTIQISPPIYGPGSQYQNVDALALNAATITLTPGTASPNGKSGKEGFAIHKDAFALVGVEMESPKGSVEICSQTRDPETGIAVRFIRQFDGRTSTMINRFDVLMGFGDLYPDNCAVKLLSA